MDFISLIMARFSTYLMNHWEEKHKPFQSISLPRPRKLSRGRTRCTERASISAVQQGLLWNEWLPRSERKNSINRCGSRASVWCPGLPSQPFLRANHRQRCPEMGQVFLSNPTDKKKKKIQENNRRPFYFVFSFSRFKHCWSKIELYPIHSSLRRGYT